MRTDKTSPPFSDSKQKPKVVFPGAKPAKKAMPKVKKPKK